MARKACSKVTFHRRGGKAVTVTRCRGRKLATSASRRYNAAKAAGRVCRKHSGRSFAARQFTKCTGWGYPKRQARGRGRR